MNQDNAQIQTIEQIEEPFYSEQENNVLTPTLHNNQQNNDIKFVNENETITDLNSQQFQGSEIDQNQNMEKNKRIQQLKQLNENYYKQLSGGESNSDVTLKPSSQLQQAQNLYLMSSPIQRYNSNRKQRLLMKRQQDNGQLSGEKMENNIQKIQSQNNSFWQNSRHYYPTAQQVENNLMGLMKQIEDLMANFCSFDQDFQGRIPLIGFQQLIFNVKPQIESIELARYMQQLKIGNLKEFEFYDVLSLIDLIEFKKQQEEENQNDITVKSMITNCKVLNVQNKWLSLYLKLLNEYKKKCDKKGVIKESSQTQNKIDDIIQTEIERQGLIISNILDEELEHIEYNYQLELRELQQQNQMQKKMFQLKAQKDIYQLKQQQKIEMEQFKEQLVGEYNVEMKRSSRNVLELQSQYKKLCKLNKFEEANTIKKQSVELEFLEKLAKQQQLFKKIEIRLKQMSKQQEMAMQSLKQRIINQQQQQCQIRKNKIDKQQFLKYQIKIIQSLNSQYKFIRREAISHQQIEQQNTLNLVKKNLNQQKDIEAKKADLKQYLNNLSDLEMKRFIAPEIIHIMSPEFKQYKRNLNAPHDRKKLETQPFRLINLNSTIDNRQQNSILYLKKK